MQHCANFMNLTRIFDNWLRTFLNTISKNKMLLKKVYALVDWFVDFNGM